MKRIVCIFALLLALLLAIGCNEETPTPDPVPDPTPEHSYFDPTHKTGTYRVDFILQSETVTHYYEAGEIPEPPEVLSFENEIFVWSFVGWREEIVPVSADATYAARYEKEAKMYEATFVMADRTVTVTARSGQIPEIPGGVADYNGMTFACWDRRVIPIATNTAYYAVYTNTASPEAMSDAILSATDLHASGWHNLHSAASLVTLAVQEYTTPLDGPLAKKLADVLEGLFSEKNGRSIVFDATTNWDFGGYTATVALAAATPTVMQRLSESAKTRMETYMRAVSYQIAYNVADANNYSSGPGMGGNYNKWRNPNYRIGNVASLAFLVHYFGEGNVTLGAERFDAMLMGFDEAAYDEMIRRFDSHGWSQAKKIWTTPAPVSGARDAKTLLLYGGRATIAPSLGIGTNGGTGKGVTSGGVPFTYHGYGLLELDEILSDVIGFAFSGGAVKSEHWYDVTGDGKPERVGYILDGTLSPMQGRDGMLLEFASDNRSSTEYNEKNFTMILTVLYAAYHLQVRTEDGTSDRLYDPTEYATLWERIQVGCEDFLYKYKRGYMCYASGMFYAGGMSESSEAGAPTGYFVMKTIWRTFFLPKGTVEPTT